MTASRAPIESVNLPRFVQALYCFQNPRDHVEVIAVVFDKLAAQIVPLVVISGSPVGAIEHLCKRSKASFQPT